MVVVNVWALESISLLSFRVGAPCGKFGLCKLSSLYCLATLLQTAVVSLIGKGAA